MTALTVGTERGDREKKKRVGRQEGLAHKEAEMGVFVKGV